MKHGLIHEHKPCWKDYLPGYSWPVFQAVCKAYDCVSGHSSSKSELTQFEEKTVNLHGDGKPSQAMEEGHSEKNRKTLSK